jgi:hypothetical protein
VDYSCYEGYFPQADYSDDERNILYNLIDEMDKESNYRAKIILLKDEDILSQK